MKCFTLYIFAFINLSSTSQDNLDASFLTALVFTCRPCSHNSKSMHQLARNGTEQTGPPMMNPVAASLDVEGTQFSDFPIHPLS